MSIERLASIVRQRTEMRGAGVCAPRPSRIAPELPLICTQFEDTAVRVRSNRQ
jgi:hypothetical protein